MIIATFVEKVPFLWLNWRRSAGFGAFRPWWIFEGSTRFLLNLTFLVYIFIIPAH